MPACRKNGQASQPGVPETFSRGIRVIPKLLIEFLLSPYPLDFVVKLC